MSATEAESVAKALRGPQERARLALPLSSAHDDRTPSLCAASGRPEAGNYEQAELASAEERSCVKSRMIAFAKQRAAS